MSRSRFRSLLGPREPAGRPGTPSPAHLPILALACTLEPEQATPVIGAVLTRVLAERRPLGTVILDLGTGTDLDDCGAEALQCLLDRLAGCGIRFRLASASAKVRAQLADAGLAGCLGRAGLQPSLRAAVLAVYAALPGPGLVTPEIRAALATPAEPVGPATLAPATPAGPATLAEPASPALPATLAEPASPALPATPAVPAIPAVPATPAVPVPAAVPARPLPAAGTPLRLTAALAGPAAADQPMTQRGQLTPPEPA